ncbi:CDP-alcohol phosphatidyltransferase family protein [Actinoplanes sp. KI2]|uniref:CDP-alcohol phosphatidyltransferase family protein n=1 Tax=Actinoplanes sp. KI2 TaxID=2983315 RepID=UPI0021D57614|nr:CDP-alcohol phosphatidyltransferase family protein [Actinoplanes sp. KI2]MCU7726121.1 CDP-alcohol phosphatidyltransferase family protein [Actinoplanes sp. KI2]
MRRIPLHEVRRRTCKPLDSWWTVLLVDPYATRLVRLVAPWRRVTPNRLTALAAVLGAAAAACFAGPGRWWPVAGALLFHCGFVADCMDGKIARLRDEGSLFGGWCDFMLDRLRAIACAAALMGGLYLHTGQIRYLWLLALVISCDLLRYLNAGQVTQLRETVEQLRTAYAQERPETIGAQTAAPPSAPGGRVKAALAGRRIRTHLFSGIEFEMAVFVVGPLIGFPGTTAIVAAVLLAIFELRIVRYAWRVSRPAAIHSLATASGPAPHSIRADASVVRQPSGISEMSENSAMVS